MKKLFYKLFVTIYICVATFVFLSGCTKDDTRNDASGETGSKTSSNTSSNTGGDLQTDDANNKSDVAANSPVSADDLSLTKLNSCVTKDGFYYLKYVEDEDSSNTLIMHLNEPSMLEIPLCNKPNCKHSDDTCNAYFGGIAPFNYIFTNQKKLYVCVSEPFDTGDKVTHSDGFIAISGDMSSQTIYSMNLDGTNREKLLELDSETKLTFPFVVSGNLLYGKRTKQSLKQTGDSQYEAVAESEELVCIDLSNGKVTVVCDFIGKDIVGIYQNKLVIQSRQSDGSPDSIPQTDEAFMEHFNNQEVSLLTYDLNTKEEKNHYKAKSNKIVNVVYEEGIACWLNADEKQFEKKDFESGEVEILPIEFKKLWPLASGIIEGKLIYSYNDGKELNAEYESEYYYDLKTGEHKERSLWIQSNSKIPVSIIEEFDGRYLVIPKHDERAEDTWAGTVQYSVRRRHYALMSKEDYLASKADYTYFTEE